MYTSVLGTDNSLWREEGDEEKKIQYKLTIAVLLISSLAQKYLHSLYGYGQ